MLRFIDEQQTWLGKALDFETMFYSLFEFIDINNTV